MGILYFLLFAGFSVLNSFLLTNLELVLATLLSLIGVFSAWLIFLYSGSVVTLFKVYGVFTYFFFGIVPALEIEYRIVYWGGSAVTEYQYAVTAMWVLLLSFFTFFAYHSAVRARLSYDKCLIPKQKRVLSGRGSFLISVFCLVIFFVVFYVNGFSVISMLFRGGEFVTQDVHLGGPAALVYGKFLRLIPIAMASVVLFLVRGSRKLKLFLIVLGLLCTFPTSIARLSVPTLYFPILVALFPFILSQYRLVLYLVLGLILIFPFLDNFRRFSLEKGFSIKLDLGYALQGHFDAFQNFSQVIDSGFITYGRQMLGVLFFYVPRSLWNDKPVGTGYQFAVDNGYYFSNISATWYMEGWANFGPLGAIFFALIIGFSMAKLDARFWRGYSGDFMKILYFVGLGYLFFLLRGDLTSGVAYLCGSVLAFLISYKLVMSSSKGL